MLPDIKELLRKYKEKTCTFEELARLKSYFSARTHESLIKENFHQEITGFVPPVNAESEPDFKEIFKKIQSQITESASEETAPVVSENRRPFYLQILKIAAVVIPLLLLGGVLSYFIIGKQARNRKI